MKGLLLALIFIIMMSLSSCKLLNIVLSIDEAPISTDLSGLSISQNVEQIITLPYTPSSGVRATSCQITNLVNIIESASCACDSASINDEWIKVPANAGNMGLDEFYVMKYEARAWMKSDGAGVIANEDSTIDAGEVDADGLGSPITIDNWVELLDPNGAAGDPIDYFPVSIPTSLPWREINADNAALRCQSLGANYQIISNVHWMAIAKDIETQPQNWTGNVVGGGCLFRGNSGEVTTGDGNNLGDSCGYDGADPDSGTSRDLRSIHTLSNGSQIYDFAGNLWEWTDWNNDIGFDLGPNSGAGTACPDLGGEQFEDVICLDLNDDDYLPLFPDPSPTHYSTLGFGQFFGGAGGAAIRGGDWEGESETGLFSLYLTSSKVLSNVYIGFRCIFVPGQ